MGKLTFNKWIEKVKMEALKSASEKIFFDIQDAYENAIHSFYKHYYPTWYERTDSTYLASSGHGVFEPKFKYKKTKKMTAIHTGIRVSPDNIPGEPYKTWNGEVFDKGIVFINTFVLGKHGTLNKKDGSPIPSLNPTPKERMDERFFEIKNKENLKKIMNRAMSNAIEKNKRR